MLKALLLIVAVFGLESLTTFLDNPTRIFLANANHAFIVRNLSDNSLMHTSKFAIMKRIYSTFIISKYGDFYVIRSGTKYVCQYGNTDVSLCDKEDYWDITPLAVGYKISKKGLKCLTLETESKVTLEPCSMDKDQTFDFKIADEDEKCEEYDVGSYRGRINPNSDNGRFSGDYDKFVMLMRNFMTMWQKNLCKTTKGCGHTMGTQGYNRAYNSKYAWRPSTGMDDGGNDVEVISYVTEQHADAHNDINHSENLHNNYLAGGGLDDNHNHHSRKDKKSKYHEDYVDSDPEYNEKKQNHDIHKDERRTSKHTSSPHLDHESDASQHTHVTYEYIDDHYDISSEKDQHSDSPNTNSVHVDEKKDQFTSI